MLKIPGYEPGDNITLLNTIYHKKRKLDSGKYSEDSIDIIYKDLDTNEKKIYHIKSPMYTYYIAKETVPVNRMAIEQDKVYPVECKYSELLKDIATRTNNLDFFYDNCRSGNFKANSRLLYIPSIFRADMDINDYYRYEFNKTYQNNIYPLQKLYFDIEVDNKLIGGEFPQPGQCPVNALTLIDESSNSVITLLLNNPKNPLIEQFKKEPHLTGQIRDFVINHVGGWKNAVRHKIYDYSYKLYFYDKEISLIADFFKYINTTRPDFAIAWNIAFDIVYLIERIKMLGYDPRGIICHQDFKVKDCEYYIDRRADTFEERNDHAQISSYTIFIDQLITFASRRKGQKKMPSYKLDDIGNIVAKVRKLDWHHIVKSLADLPYVDYKTFVFYNIMDTIVQHCIENKAGDIDFIFNKAINTSTRYAKIHRQSTYLVNRGIMDFEDMGYIMGNNVNGQNQKASFPGAFCAELTQISDKPKIRINGRAINIVENCDDFDKLYVAA